MHDVFGIFGRKAVACGPIVHATARPDDARLRGEIADKLNLLIGKGVNFLEIDVDRTDQLVLFEHRDVDKSPGASQFEETGAHGIALVDRLGLDIGNLSWLLRRHHASERGPRYGTQEQVFSSLLDIRRWRIMVGDKAEGLSFAEIECRKFGLA